MSLFYAFGASNKFLSIHESRIFSKEKIKSIHHKMYDLPTIFSTNVFYNNNSDMFEDSFSVSSNNYFKFKEYFDVFFEETEKSSLEPIIIDPYLYLSIDFLIKEYPESNFILLVRNGYSVVESYYNRPKTAYSENIMECNEKQLLLNMAKPFPNKFDVFFDQWSLFDRLQKISWFWNHINYNLYKKIKSIKNGYILKTENIKEVSKIFPSVKKRFVKVKNKGKYKKKLFLEKKNLIKFNSICEETMKIFNYDIID